MTDRWDGRGPACAPCTVDFWLPTAAGATGATWFWPSEPSAVAPVGVVLVPGIIHDQQATEVGLVALGRDLASRGVPALLIDLAGTAQGSGTLETPDVVDQWGDDVRSAVSHARRCGVEHVVVLGVRLGALVAIDALSADPVDLMVLWAPVLSGRRYVKELRMMQAAAAHGGGDDLPGVTIGGHRLPPHLLDDLRRLDADRIDGKPASELCLVDTADRLEVTTNRLFDEVATDRIVARGTEPWLFTDPIGFAAPWSDLAAVRDRIERAIRRVGLFHSGSHDVPAMPQVATQRSREFHHDGVAIRETFVTLGTAGLTGILSEPVGGAEPGAPTYLAVTRTGPGRMFVDLARREASRGRATLRFDLAGFGTSGRRRHQAWADYYHPTAADDISEAVDELVCRGFSRIVVVGFCAGAWSALQMRPHPAVERIVGVNVQLAVRGRSLRRQEWPTLTAHRRIAAALAKRDVAQRLLWKYECGHPLPSPTSRWIRRHRAAGTEVVTVFDADDIGLDVVRRRSRPRRRLRSALLPAAPPTALPIVRTYAGLGHLPGGTAREAMFEDLHRLTTEPPG